MLYYLVLYFSYTGYLIDKHQRQNGLKSLIRYFCSMKHSQIIGIVLCLALFYFTTLPLVIIESKSITVTGWSSNGTNFGLPGKFILYIGTLAVIFFALPFIWAKRFNMAFAALLIAWSFRNFIVLSTCQMGECPQKQFALYACIVVSFAIMIMTFLPKVKLPYSNNV